jgi:hypothetical protein
MNKNTNKPTINVILVAGQYFIHWGNTRLGNLRVINTKGLKAELSPSPEKLQIVKSLRVEEFNNCFYFGTKIGVFSVQTGRKIVHPAILKIFEK